MKKPIEEDKRLGEIDDYEGDGVAMFLALFIVAGIIACLCYVYVTLTGGMFP